MIRKMLSYALLMLIAGCIDPLDFENIEQQKHLVVEGDFTNQPELNYVRLTYAQPYKSPYNEYITDAEIFVTSSEGEHYRFIYGGGGGNFAADKSGVYYPASPLEAVGVAGHTYTLHVVVGGKTYQSKPATLKVPVPIDAVHFEVDEQAHPFPGHVEKRVSPGYNVLVNYKDPAGEKNFLRWSFIGRYQIKTQPRDFVLPWGVPAPKECCVECFVTEEFNRFKVINDRLTNGKDIINQEVLFLPFERYLGMKHELTIYQHSLTEEAYAFFRIMEQQKETTGTVFDPPPAEVKGNMFNVNEEGEQVIGFFSVSAVSMKEETILQENIDHLIPLYRFPDDCRLLWGAVISTTERPEGW